MADLFRLSAVSAFSDNYIWVLHDQSRAIAVDPGDATPLLAFLAQQQLALSAVWITHHHADHIGGLPQLARHFSGLPVYGPAGVSGVTQAVGEGDTLTAFGSTVQVWAIPGHTANHLAYLAGQHLFCGDTLFGAGCGRVFDGSIAQLFHSLQRLAALPPETLCYPAHEYTLSNLTFAAVVEPGNAAIHARRAADSARRAQGLPTVPTPLAAELASNPFLRTAIPEVGRSASQHAGQNLTDNEDIFATLRSWKNQF
ncbi:hydroxyacylglutathione hydrolase [Vogesella perlucida]|nr:hydroxyacylglutathione hydrolase [Vogesella perlucida]